MPERDWSAFACPNPDCPAYGQRGQIMSLLQLAPDIQEALLFLPPTVRGRDPVILADLMPIAARIDWRTQRRLWRRLVPTWGKYLTFTEVAVGSAAGGSAPRPPGV
jgi:hypothetical protein